jgi:ATP-binding cassette subfamily F protein 3
MALLTLQNVTKAFGPLTVLDGVNLVAHPGEKVGLVGANGAGKTTVFRLMIGQINPDIGEVSRSRGLRIGYLPQQPELDSTQTLFAEARGALDEVTTLETRLAELSERIAQHSDPVEQRRLMDQYDRLQAHFETAGGYDYEVQIGEVLGGLGFSPADYDTPISTLSGGQKCRLALARLLLNDADLLLLDEPTNHLDIPASSWLEKWLLDYKGCAIVVSHDRYLLSRVVGKIIEVENRQLTVWGCGYAEYTQARSLARLTARRAYDKQQAHVAKEKRFIESIIATKRGSTAKGRRTRLERMEREGGMLAKPTGPAPDLAVNFKSTSRGGDMVLRCENVHKRFGDVVLFAGFDFEMGRGEKVGILGDNGVGKTTLLKMALGQVAPDQGAVRLYENLRVGYYDQEQTTLNLDNTVIDEIMPQRSADEEQRVRSFLAGFLFFGDEVFKKVGRLSGGEQSRVMLARQVWARPHVLILDEPTNHLDIPGREALEKALIEFDGSVLVVSHDRYFLDRVVQRLIVLERGRYEDYPGNYSFYAARKEAEARRAAVAKDAARHARGPVRTPPRKRAADKAPPDPYAAMSLKQIEGLIEQKQRRVDEIEEAFARPDLYQDHQRVAKLREEYDAVRAEVEAITAVWLERVEQMG